MSLLMFFTNGRQSFTEGDDSYKFDEKVTVNIFEYFQLMKSLMASIKAGACSFDLKLILPLLSLYLVLHCEN